MTLTAAGGMGLPDDGRRDNREARDDPITGEHLLGLRLPVISTMCGTQRGEGGAPASSVKDSVHSGRYSAVLNPLSTRYHMHWIIRTIMSALLWVGERTEREVAHCL